MGDVEDRAIGVLVGLAAGDRVGGPIRMALRVAESLRDRGEFDPSDIGRRYLDWWSEGAVDTGPTVARVLSLAASGLPFDQAATRVDQLTGGMTAGCNPAHRAAPLAMCAALPDDGLARAALAEALLTHRNRLAGDVAAAVVCLCRALIRGVAWQAALEWAADGRGPETRRALATNSPRLLSRDGFAPNVLAAAVYFVGASSAFPEALTLSVEFAGRPNYCPVLVGSIGGARWGRAGIEESSLAHPRALLQEVEAVARDLAGPWAPDRPTPA